MKILLFLALTKGTIATNGSNTLSGLRESAVYRGGRFGKKKLGGDQPGYWQREEKPLFL